MDMPSDVCSVLSPNDEYAIRMEFYTLFNPKCKIVLPIAVGEKWDDD